MSNLPSTSYHLPSTALLGVSGTNGSGKDSLCKYLAEQYGWVFVPVTDMFRAELRARGLPVERKNLRMISEEWRIKDGLGAVVNRAIEEALKHNNQPKGIVIASIRNPGEVDRLLDLNGKMLWVDADPKIRYARVTAANRGRGGEDDVTFEEFLMQQEEEMFNPSGDPNKLNMSEVKKKCDLFYNNNFSNYQDFYKDLDIFLKKNKIVE